MPSLRRTSRAGATEPLASRGRSEEPDTGENQVESTGRRSRGSTAALKEQLLSSLGKSSAKIKGGASETAATSIASCSPTLTSPGTASEAAPAPTAEAAPRRRRRYVPEGEEEASLTVEVSALTLEAAVRGNAGVTHVYVEVDVLDCTEGAELRTRELRKGAAPLDLGFRHRVALAPGSRAQKELKLALSSADERDADVYFSLYGRGAAGADELGVGFVNLRKVLGEEGRGAAEVQVTLEGPTGAAGTLAVAMRGTADAESAEAMRERLRRQLAEAAAATEAVLDRRLAEDPRPRLDAAVRDIVAEDAAHAAGTRAAGAGDGEGGGRRGRRRSVGVGGVEVPPEAEFDAVGEEPAAAAALERERELLQAQARQVVGLARQLRRPEAVPGLVSVGEHDAMLVGADEVVREVHAAMVAWDGSAGALSRLADVHEAGNLTPAQRKLLAHAATEVRLARRAHLVQQERLQREREALAEGVNELVWQLGPTLRAAGRGRNKPDEREKGTEGELDLEADEAEEDIVRSAAPREPSLTTDAVAAPRPPAKPAAADAAADADADAAGGGVGGRRRRRHPDGLSAGAGGARTLEVHASVQYRQPAHAPPTPAPGSAARGGGAAAAFGGAGGADLAALHAALDASLLPRLGGGGAAAAASPAAPRAPSAAANEAASAAAAAFAARWNAAPPPPPPLPPPPQQQQQQWPPAAMAAMAAAPRAAYTPAAPGFGPGYGAAYAPPAPPTAASKFIAAAATSHLVRQRNQGGAVDVEAALRYGQSVVGDVGTWQPAEVHAAVAAARDALTRLAQSWSAPAPPRAPAAALRGAPAPIGVWAAHPHLIHNAVAAGHA